MEEDDDNRSWFKKETSFPEGSMWEGYPWKILEDVICSEYGGGEPCKHCGEPYQKEEKRWDGSSYFIKEWVCPFVVEAYNEGNCASTGVCLECILEAAYTFARFDPS